MSNISKEQHPSPVKSDGKPLHGDVNECHGNSQSKDDPGEAETPFLSTLQGQDTETQKPKLCMKSNRRKFSIWAVAVACHLLAANPLGLRPSDQLQANAAACSLGDLIGKKREAMGVSCSQCAWVQEGDREETLLSSQTQVLPGSSDYIGQGPLA